MNNDESFKSKSVNETLAFGRKLGKKLESGDIVGLHGPLGSGKTHLVKGIAEAFGVQKEAVQSPTYTLINEYDGHLSLYHLIATG